MERYRHDDGRLARYSERCAERVWRVQDFSMSMATMLHPSGDDDFDAQLQLPRLRSRARRVRRAVSRSATWISARCETAFVAHAGELDCYASREGRLFRKLCAIRTRVHGKARSWSGPCRAGLDAVAFCAATGADRRGSSDLHRPEQERALREPRQRLLEGPSPR